MKDLLEPVLKFLPTYLPNFYRLVVRPKTSIVQCIDEDQADLTRPLAFVACTVAIGFLLQLPILGKENDFGRLVAAMAVFKLVALVSVAIVIHLVFRLFRGRAGFAATLSAYLYLVGPLYLGGIVIELIKHGILRSHSPAMASAERINPGLLRNTPELWTAFQARAPGLASAYDTLNLVTFGFIIAWFIVCWGAFRRLHGRGWFASTTVGIVSLVVGGTLLWGLSFLMQGMFGTAAPILR